MRAMASAGIRIRPLCAKSSRRCTCILPAIGATTSGALSTTTSRAGVLRGHSKAARAPTCKRKHGLILASATVASTRASISLLVLVSTTPTIAAAMIMSVRAARPPNFLAARPPTFDVDRQLTFGVARPPIFGVARQASFGAGLPQTMITVQQAVFGALQTTVPEGRGRSIRTLCRARIDAVSTATKRVARRSQRRMSARLSTTAGARGPTTPTQALPTQVFLAALDLAGPILRARISDAMVLISIETLTMGRKRAFRWRGAAVAALVGASAWDTRPYLHAVAL